MQYYIRLRLLAVCSLVGLYGVVTTLHQSSYASSNLSYASLVNPHVAQPETMPTSDAVPFPICRASFINLSHDEAYPIPHWVYALPHDADKALVLAIAKNESRFKPYARSHKGAVGLMQLMPATANYIVSEHGASEFLVHTAAAPQQSAPSSAFDFNDPYISLAVGHRYIEHLQARPYIGDNVVYTLAAYNAGPANLRRWKRAYGHLSDESFAAHIPFTETRNYVRKVMRDYAAYRQMMPVIQDTVWIDGEQC